MEGFDGLKENVFPLIPKGEVNEITRIIEKYGEKRLFKKGEYLLFQGDVAQNIYFLSSGCVKIFSYSSDGKEKTLWYAFGNNFINEIPYFHGLPSNGSIKMVHDSVCYKINDRVLENISREKIAREIYKGLAIKIRILVNQVMWISFLTPLERIGQLLYFLGVEYGTSRDGDVRIFLKVSQEEISKLLSLHRVTVSKYINKLIDRGILHYDDAYHLVINDLEKLYEISFEE